MCEASEICRLPALEIMDVSGMLSGLAFLNFQQIHPGVLRQCSGHIPVVLILIPYKILIIHAHLLSGAGSSPCLHGTRPYHLRNRQTSPAPIHSQGTQTAAWPPVNRSIVHSSQISP